VGWFEPQYPLVHRGAESYLNGVCGAPADSKWVDGSVTVRSKVEPPPCLQSHLIFCLYARVGPVHGVHPL